MNFSPKRPTTLKISDITLYNVCVQYIGGYHEYIGGGGGTMNTSGDIMSTSGDVQYIGGIP